MKMTIEDLNKWADERDKKLIAELKVIPARQDILTVPAELPQYTVREKMNLWFGAAMLPGFRAKAPDFIKKDLTEGTGSAGGFLVPVEYRTEFIKRLAELSEVFPYVRRIPVSTDTGKIPRLLTDVTVTWAASENPTTGHETTPAFEQLSWDIQKLLALVDVSEDLVQDSNPDALQVVTDLLIEAVAAEVDRSVVIGENSNCPYGIYYRVKDVAAQLYNVNGALNYHKLVAIEHKVAAKYRKAGNCRWIMPDTVHGYVMKLTDDNGQPIIRRGAEMAAAETLLGYPISIQDMNGRSSEIIFGNTYQYIWFDRQQVTVETQSTGSKWEYDQRVVKCKLRADGDTGITAAFGMGYTITG